ncbi:tetratricopeptide repeat protein [Clostridiales bacterium oral taxon 876 str. F0540]|nr:tetratricopeptide repeat protein [Clostridiales bacterium oral taxon 876 str. F0540]
MSKGIGGCVVENNKSMRYLDIYNSSDNWEKGAFDEFPSVIAQEYHNLYSLLGQGHVYGAYFKLKDVFEILLKFPLLIYISQIFHEQQEELKEEEKLLIKSMFISNISMGIWVKLARLAVSTMPENHPLKAVISHIVDIIDENEIVSWRNKYIGHGSLQSEKSEEFYETIQNHIGLIKNHIEVNYDFYKELNLYGQFESLELPLKGRVSGDSLSSIKKDSLYVSFKEGRVVSLYPFMLASDGGIYFFDTYYSDKKRERTLLLNYPESKKKIESINKLDRFYDAIKHYPELETLQENAEDDALLSDEEDELNKYYHRDDIIIPDYILNNVKQFVRQEKKGIILLQMESGTGKTTFVRLIDECISGKTYIEGCAVRAFYANDTYNSSIHSFTEGVRDALKKTSKTGGTEIRPKKFSTNISNCEDLARVLGKFRAEHYEASGFKKSKLMLAIDGVDEIPGTNEETVFNLIPDYDMLPDNVFILITCRTDKELSGITKAKLETIDTAKEHKIIIPNTQKDYKNTLMQYLDNAFKKHKKEYDYDKLKRVMENCGNKFVYASLIAGMLNLDENIEFDKLISVRNLHKILWEEGGEKQSFLLNGAYIFETYFKGLQDFYGKVYYKQIVKLIIVALTSYEPLTLRQLSYLCGEEKLSLRFLAYMSLIKPFVSIGRSKRGNVFFRNHVHMRAYIIEHFSDEMKKYILEWVDTVKNFKDIQIKTEGEAYIAESIFSYITDFVSKDPEVYFDRDFMYHLINCADNMYDNKIPEADTRSYISQKGISTYRQALYLWEESSCGSFGQDFDVNILRAMVRTGAYKKAYSYVQMNLVVQDNSYRDSMIKLYMGMGDEYSRSKLYSEAAEHYSNAVSFIRDNEAPEYYYEELAEAYIKLGHLKIRLGDMLQGISFYTEAIEISCQLKGTHKWALIKLIEAYSCRAYSNYKMDKCEAAFDDSAKAIKLLDELEDSDLNINGIEAAYLVYAHISLKHYISGNSQIGVKSCIQYFNEYLTDERLRILDLESSGISQAYKSVNSPYVSSSPEPLYVTIFSRFIAYMFDENFDEAARDLEVFLNEIHEVKDITGVLKRLYLALKLFKDLGQDILFYTIYGEFIMYLSEHSQQLSANDKVIIEKVKTLFEGER